MAFDFPDSPSLNQTYSEAGRTWIWDGTAWNAVASPTEQLPDQDGNSGEFLTTDGSSLSWAVVPEPDYSSDQSIIAGQVFG